MSITVYPIPHQLLTSPYLDQLYAPMANAPGLTIRRIGFRSTLQELLLQRSARIAHWHFFDELTQVPAAWQTAARTIAFMGLLRTLRLRGVQQIWTAHNIEPHELRHPAWANRAYIAMLRTANAVIAHSQAAADLLRRRYAVQAAIHVIPHGSYVGLHGPRRDRRESRAQLGLPADEFIALNLGTFRPYKGLELLLDAWQDMPGQLLIVGGAKDQAYASQLKARAALQPNIRVQPQFVPDADLPLWFAAADVIVLPYRKLLSSGILLWALSYGVPVVAPAVAPVQELISEGQQGFLFAPESLEELRAALWRAINHPQLSALGERAYQAALPFDWPTIAAKTAALYRAVAQRA